MASPKAPWWCGRRAVQPRAATALPVTQPLLRLMSCVSFLRGLTYTCPANPASWASDLLTSALQTTRGAVTALSTG